MKILLTGAKGQVGREIVDLVCSRYPETQLFAFTKSELDVANLEQVATAVLVHRPQVVINAAAYTAVDKAEQEQKLAFSINRDGVKNLALVCKEHNLPLIHVSTDYVFDGDQETPYCEDDTRSPMNVYGASKAEGELALQSIWEKHLIIRVSWVFGQYGNNFVKTILKLAAKEKELKIVADQTGCPTPASQIAATLLSLAEKVSQENPSWGIFHYSGDRPVTWFEFANTIIKHGQKLAPHCCPKVHSITTNEFPRPAKRPKNSVMKVDKIREAYGIAPADWEEALVEVIKKIHEPFST